MSRCIVQLFFVKHQAFTAALSKAGYSAGALFWSNFTEFAIAKYGYKGALLLVAGVNLHGYVIAAIFREPNYEIQMYPCKDVPSDTDPPMETRNAERSLILETEDDHNSEAPKQYSDITGVGENTTNKQGDSWPNDNPSRNCKKFCDIFSGIIDVSLLKMPTFSLFCVAVFLGDCGNTVPLGFIPLRLSLMGISKYYAAVLIMTLGISGAFGRILVGWVADRPWTNRKLMFACGNFLAGCLSFIAYFFSDYRALIAYCILFATTSGRDHTNFSQLINHWCAELFWKT